MSDIHRQRAERISTYGAKIEAIVDRFEEAWQTSPPAAVGDFLPSEDAERREALSALVAVDLEYRWKLANDLDSVASSLDSTVSPKPAVDVPTRPRVEDYLQQFPELGRAETLLLELTIAEYRARHRWGDRPAHADYADRFPAFVEAIAVALRHVDDELAAQPPANVCEQASPGAGDDPFAFHVTDEGLLVGHTSERLEERYEVQGRLGAGGMGEVWRAVDRRLRRPVAIKRMHAELADSRAASARFLREARAIAALSHAYIAQVFDFGCDPEGYFIVMEYVEGENLASLVRRSGPLPPAKATQITMQLCQALGMAHARGVVHRDVKPANVLWTTSGVPKLTDFGVARFDHSADYDTQSGMVMGTLEYMAPEQRCDPRLADGRSDLWSLAATFYQLLTGSPPRVIRPTDVPEALQPVLLKALREAPSERYATAEEFAEALRAAQAEMDRSVVTSTPADAAGRCPKCQTANDPSLKFCRRCGGSLREPCPRCQRPIVVGAAFCGECGANVEAVVCELRAAFDGDKVRIESLLDDFRYPDAIAKLELLAADSSPALVECSAWANGTLAAVRAEYERLTNQRGQLFATAQQRYDAHEYAAAVHVLEQIPKKFWDERNQALYTLAQNQGRKLQFLADEILQAQHTKRFAGLVAKVEEFLDLKPGHQQAHELLARLYTRQCTEVRRFKGGYAAVTTCLAVSSDGGHVFVGGADGTLRLVDLQTGRQIQRFVGHEGEVRGVVVSPDKQTVLSVGQDGTVRFWDMGAGRQLHRCEGHKQSVTCGTFSNDGRVALTGGSDCTVRVWDVTTGRELRRCVGHQSTVLCIAAMQDVPYALSGGVDGTLRRWHLRTGTQMQEFQAHTVPVLAVAITPDGQHAISASGADAKAFDYHLRLWRFQSGQQVHAFGGAPPVRAVALTRDGRYLLSGGRDGSLRLWQVASGRELYRYAGHVGEIVGLSMATDARIAVSAGTDQTIRVWRLPE